MQEWTWRPTSDGFQESTNRIRKYRGFAVPSCGVSLSSGQPGLKIRCLVRGDQDHGKVSVEVNKGLTRGTYSSYHG